MTDVLPVAQGILDSDGMFPATAGLPEQLEQAALSARAMAGLPEADELAHIVVLGMGGSGVAGDVLTALARSACRLPVTHVDSYELPAFVDARSLVFAVSFSGGTEETLAGTKEAIARGAWVVGVSGGGELAELCAAHDKPCYGIAPGITWPRAGLGATLAPLLVACEEIGLLPGARAGIDQAVAQLRTRRAELVAPGGGLGGEIARQIDRSFPLIHGASGIGAVAARRWKTQVNENAKAPAFFGSQPEVCHNEICGFGQSGDVTRQIITLCLLRHDFEHPRTAARFGLLAEAVSETVSSVIEVRASGKGELAQFFDLTMIGDFVSLHLAAREGIDPGPVPVLMELKEALARLS